LRREAPPLRAAHGSRCGLGGAFAAQVVDLRPVAPNDVALDAVATERGIIRRGKN
jgi:5-formyltetrahydrofolate cyclo-ligase